MGILKKLAGQTAYYGLSSMLGRLLNFLLVPLYTNEITPPSRMGIVAFLYALAALFNVFLSYGMETAFFRYSSDGKYGKKTVASTAFTSLFISTPCSWYLDCCSTARLQRLSVMPTCRCAYSISC